MSADKIHLHFVFNGINYYAPFFQQSVACVIRTGDPVLKNIVRASKDLKILMGKLPGKLSINARLKQVSKYMDAASKIIQKTHLTCGNSLAFEMMTMELPGIDPFLEGTVRSAGTNLKQQSPRNQVQLKSRNWREVLKREWWAEKMLMMLKLIILKLMMLKPKMLKPMMIILTHISLCRRPLPQHNWNR